MCLHHILLLTFQSFTPPAVWWNTIWIFCHSIKCSFWPTIITSWWRLQKWLRYHWLTHSFKEDLTHSPCFHHGTCFFQPSSHHTMQHTTNSTQTSVQMLILLLSRQLHSRQHPSMLRQFRSWRGRLPDGTFGWWTLDFWRNTWKNMCSWTWSTTWIMLVSMPLCKLSNSLLHRQFGFKWHFWLWGLYGYIQWWGDTRDGGSTILIWDSGLLEHLFY